MVAQGAEALNGAAEDLRVAGPEHAPGNGNRTALRQYFRGMETTTITRVDALAHYARAIRRHFGDRLEALYALPDHPFEEGDDETLYVVVVLAGKTWPDVDAVADAASEAAAQQEGGYSIHPFVLDAARLATGDPLAQRVRAEGVAL